MAKISAIEREATRKRIIKVSKETFRKYGYHDTQIKMIAKKVGIGVSTIYGYFPSKIDLFTSSFLEIGKYKSLSNEFIEEALEDGLIKGLINILNINNSIYFSLQEDTELVRTFFIARLLNNTNEKCNNYELYNKNASINFIVNIIDIFERKNKRLCAFSLKDLAECIINILKQHAWNNLLLGEINKDNIECNLEKQLQVFFSGKYEKY